ncbi:MAG: hypothetical protein NVS4B11_13580 [Ktedonobacteraceae bacterium]
MPEKFIVLDPTLDIQVARAEQAPRPKQFRTVGLLDNGKPNSDKLLKKVAALLAEQHPGLVIKQYRKSSAYRPAPGEIIDQLVAECDIALVGIGD